MDTVKKGRPTTYSEEERKKHYKEYQKNYHKSRYSANSVNENKMRKSYRLANKMTETNPEEAEIISTNLLKYKHLFYDVYQFKHLLRTLPVEVIEELLGEK
jgi:hypothetical protein